MNQHKGSKGQSGKALPLWPFVLIFPQPVAISRNFLNNTHFDLKIDS
jgi:hypothetical protein